MPQIEAVELNGTLVYVTCEYFDMTFFWGGGEAVMFGDACKVVNVLDCCPVT